jgi:hypothetical protein
MVVLMALKNRAYDLKNRAFFLALKLVSKVVMKAYLKTAC